MDASLVRLPHTWSDLAAARWVKGVKTWVQPRIRVLTPFTLRKQNGMPFTLPFSPDTIRWRRAAILELRKLGIEL